MANTLLKIDYKIVHKWANTVLTPIHTVAITPLHMVEIPKNLTVLKGYDNVIHTYIHKNTKTLT